MNLGPVIKLDKRNKTTSKKSDADFLSKNCDVNVIFWIFSQFGAIRRSDSGHRACKSYVSVKVTFCLTKTENGTKKSLTALTLLLWVTLIFSKKCWHQQNSAGLGTKRYIFWNYIWVCTHMPIVYFLAWF